MPVPFVEIKTQVVAEVVLDDGRFATILKPKMGHILNAKHSDDTIWMAQLMTHVVGFDGKAVSLEEVLNITVSDFSKIAEQIGKNLK